MPEASRPMSSEPLDTTVGAVTPFGPVVVRTNRFEGGLAQETRRDPQTGLTLTNAASSSFDGASSVVLRAQVGLARIGISAGSIDGKLGPQTFAAIRAFQQRYALPVTGQLDAATRSALEDGEPVLRTYIVTSEDLGRPMPIPGTWLGKSELARLDYESVLELVAEKSQSHPSFLQRLNPQIDWLALIPGTPVQIPNVESVQVYGRPSSIRIMLTHKVLQAFDAEGHLMFHFPCSIARDKEKRPVGELKVEKIAPNPNYTFNPDVFPESEEGRQLGRKLIIQPGPNNPVGTAWIGLDRPGYGIHGTPHPEQVGRTESHGCFRLANWNAERLINLVWVGLPVQVEN